MEKMPEMVSAAVVLSVLRCCCFFFCLLATPRAAVASAAPTPTVCANSGTTPVMLGEPLRFCGNTGISCCDTADDDALREELHAMNVPDATCAAIVKSFLCARCIPSLSFVFSPADPTKLSVPLLCASAQAQPTAGSGTTTTRPAQEQDTSSMCLERISAASFHAMTAHPDGSGRVFLTSRDSKVWLATMPRRGAGAALRIDDDGSARRRPFLDLTEDHGGVLRVVGVAFHPEFTTNGRFFVSYICNSRSVSPTACGGGGAGSGSGRSRPCRYHLVVAEFSAQGGAGADFSKATRADPSEVRRIFTMGLPQPQFKMYSYQRHGGQILFRPSESDGYLYVITGYGYSSSNKQYGSSSGSFLGKILRFNVGNGSAGGSEWLDTDRQPDRTRTDDRPEMFAAGLNNPSACSFDSDRPSHLLCADVSEQRSEKVYLITKQLGGRKSSSSSVAATVSVVVNRGRPADGRMPSIVGGIVYRGSAEPSLNGRYLYVYASGVWSSGWSGRYASVPVPNVSCSWSSPMQCRSSHIGINGIGSHVLSMAEDNSKDAFFLTTAGVFRIVPSSACGARPQPPPQAQWPAGTGWLLSVGATAVALALYVCWAILGGGGQIRIGGGCCSGRNFCFSNSIFCCSYS